MLRRSKGSRILSAFAAGITALTVMGAAVFGATSAEIAEELNKTHSDIAAAEAEQEAARSSLNDTYGRIDELSEAEAGLAAYLDDLTAQITALTEALTALEAEITQTTADIESARQALTEARAAEEEQYDSMKVRIRYMYENGQATYMNALLGAADLTEFLNRAEEVRRITEYDRESLDDYKAACAAREAEELDLLEKQAELEDLKAEQEAKQAEVQALADETGVQLAAYRESLAAEREAASAYEARIAEQTERLEALRAQAAAQEEARQKAAEEEARRAEEERRAAEEAARRAAEEAARKKADEEAAAWAKKAAEAESSVSTAEVMQTAANYDYSQAELELIWAIVAQEDDKSYTGALAVITCAMNRAEINYGGHGTDPLSQLTAAGQFCYSPSISASVHWQRRLGGHVPDHVKQAVSDALGGLRNHGCLYFRSYGGPGRTKIGGNYFF